MEPPVPKDTFNQNDLEIYFRQSMQNATAIIFIESAYITVDGVKRFAHEFIGAVARAVTCCVIVEKPEGWDRRDDPKLNPSRRADLKKVEAAVDFLRALGVHVTLRAITHNKIAVIDYKETYGGCLNILSYTGKKDDECWRWQDEAWAHDTVKRRRFDECEVCSKAERTPRAQVFLSPNSKVHGSRIGELRRAAGLSQRQLSEQLSVTRETLSNIETGKVQARADLLIQIYAALERSLVAVPPSIVPIIQRLMHTDKP